MTRTAVRIAAQLLEDRDSLASAVTARLYAQVPELAQRYGEQGRVKCLQDMRYNIEHLVPAVELENPGLFEDYVGWLDALLQARGVATNDVRRALQLLRREVDERYDADASHSVARVIDAGLRRLGAPA